MEKNLLKILEKCNNNIIDAETAKLQVLDLFSVNQQRELLEAFVKQIKEDNEFVDDITFQDINKCLSSNCG